MHLPHIIFLGSKINYLHLKKIRLTKQKQKITDRIFWHVAGIYEKIDYLLMKVWAIIPSPALGMFDLLIETSSGKVS